MIGKDNSGRYKLADWMHENGVWKMKLSRLLGFDDEKGHSYVSSVLKGKARPNFWVSYALSIITDGAVVRLDWVMDPTPEQIERGLAEIPKGQTGPQIPLDPELEARLAEIERRAHEALHLPELTPERALTVGRLRAAKRKRKRLTSHGYVPRNPK